MAEVILPGTYITVRDEALISAGRVSTGNIGIVGTANKGQVGKVTILSSFTEAREAFGQADPWEAIRAATERVTADGTVLGENETVSAADALMGFLGPLEAPHECRYLEAGAPADCCLMDLPWSSLQHDLHSSHVRMTLRGGSVIYSRD